MTHVLFRNEASVDLVSSMGTDASICNAARVSTGAQTDVARNRGLINFLMRDRHGSCFEHTSLTFIVTAPLFVFYEWHRHRAGWSYSEESARYRELEPVFYMPDSFRPLQQVGKPGAYTFEAGTQEQILAVRNAIFHNARSAYAQYTDLLAAGVAKEVARMVLPNNIYKTMYATCNVRSLMHFLSLRRSDPDNTVPTNPLHEFSQVAGKVEELFKEAFPDTHAAFVANGRVGP